MQSKVPEVFKTSVPLLPHERLANWELRKGHHLAAERMRLACVHQSVDTYVARHVREPFTPRLPNEVAPC